MRNLMPKVVQYKSGSVIYFEGDIDERIFILQKGSVSLNYLDIETRGAISEYLKEGEFFGVKSSLAHFPREETVRVLSDSLVISMSIAEFEKLVMGNPKLIIKMLKVFSGQLRSIHQKTESVLKAKEASNTDDGLYSVAQLFYNEGYYSLSCDVCMRYLSCYKQGVHKEAVARLYVEAKSKVSSEVKQNIPPMPQSFFDNGYKLFSLPGFSRFAKSYKPGTLIFSEFEQGDCFYLIQAGRVQLVKCVQNMRKNLDILMPSEFFGEMAILENSPRSATAIAIDTVEVLEFNKENFEVLMTGNPMIALILLRMFCKRIFAQKRRFKVVTTVDIQARVGDVFLMLEETQSYMTHQDIGRRFDVKMQDVAQWAALPIDTVTEEINRFLSKHKIEVFESHMVVANMADMRRFVESKRLLEKKK